jgi:hypothetical protein
MVEMDVQCHIEAFRRFLVMSTCRSFIPESYIRDPEVFPEKEAEPGSIYIEAVDKVTLKKIRDITFVNANEVLGIIYNSKSGNSKLKWRQVRGPMGRVTGEASNHSLVNLSMAGVISPDYVEELARRMPPEPRPQEERTEESASPPPPSAEPADVKIAPPSAPPPPVMVPRPPDFPLEEEEGDFDAADSDEDEVEDIAEQEREETA